jgi:hypothetical protein
MSDLDLLKAIYKSLDKNLENNNLLNWKKVLFLIL